MEKKAYFTNRSFSVAHKDVSHASPLESSSSALLNQPPPEDLAGFLAREDSLGVAPFELEELLSRRRNPSMALPMSRASTKALLPSHFKRPKGDRDFFGALVVGVSFDEPLDEDESFNFSNASLANVTVVCWVVDLEGRLEETGWWRLANHPEGTEILGDVEGVAAFLAAASSPPVICLMPLRMDTSKLLERLDFFKLFLRSGFKMEVLCGVGGCISPQRFISVAEDASDDSKEIKSVLVQTMPAFLEGVGGACVTTHGDNNTEGFSDARRLDIDWMGASVVPTKSEYRRLLV